MSVPNAKGSQKPAPARRRDPKADEPKDPAPAPQEPEVVDPQPLAASLADPQEPSASLADPQEPSASLADPEPRFITVSFVEDGFIALGRTWYRGQELTVEEGSDDWERTITNGRSWLEFSEDDQVNAWGRRMFRHGQWTGKGYDLNDPTLTPEERQQLAIATGAILPPSNTGRPSPPKL